MSLLYRVFFSVLHCIAHVFVYCIPNFIINVCVRWPLTALELATGEKNLTFSPGRARHIRIMAHPTDHHVLHQFGFSEDVLVNPTLKPSAAAEHRPVYDGPLYNRHMHMAMGAYRPTTLLPGHAELVPSFDGARVRLDFFYPTDVVPNSPRQPRALVLMMPGLTGSSSEVYIQRFAARLLKQNVAVVVLSARGVAGAPLDTPQMFSACFTQDVRHVLENYLTAEQVQQRLGNSKPIPLIGLAFSLGGVILSNYVSEQGARAMPSRLDAVYTVTSPHDLNASDEAMNAFPTRVLYRSVFGGYLRTLFERHAAMLQRLPGIDHNRLFGGAHPLFAQLRTVRDFDEYITAPHFGFSNADAYYNAANNIRNLRHSTTPQVCLVAADDPICGAPLSPVRWDNLIRVHRGGLLYVEMPVGSHLGFLDTPWREWRGAANPMERFLIASMVHFIDAHRKSSLFADAASN